MRVPSTTWLYRTRRAGMAMLTAALAGCGSAPSGGDGGGTTDGAVLHDGGGLSDGASSGGGDGDVPRSGTSRAQAIPIGIENVNE